MSWIQTYTGRRFDLLNPAASDVDIRDIAHALSNCCRFAGHTKQFYSVAQHSVIVSRVCEPRDALYGLLHDAAEAYTGDLTRPLKKTLPEFYEIERRIEAAIFVRFGLRHDSEAHARIKFWDDRLLATEVRDFMVDVSGMYPQLPQPLKQVIIPWLTPQQSVLYFSRRFVELTVGEEKAELLVKHLEEALTNGHAIGATANEGSSAAVSGRDKFLRDLAGAHIS